MFNLLTRNVLPKRRDLCLFNCSSSSSISVRFNSTDSTTHNSFVVSYLINSCGVPKDKAISYPKRFHFESSENPDTVLAYLRENGFSNYHISTVIGKHPYLLLSKIDKTLKPKFDFFKSQGITGTDFADVVCRDPYVLSSSLEKTIIPCFDLIKSIVHTDARLLVLLRRSPKVLMHDPRKKLLPNIALLRAQGVPADNLAKFLVSQPRAFLKPTSRFREIVEEVKKMKFDPKQCMFLLAVQGLASMTRSSLEAKFDVYRRWGLSQDEVQLMFRKNPNCLMMSEKKIMSTMSYFVNEMGYTPSYIVKQPNALLPSLKRKIIPRCSVLQILKSKGLDGNVGSLVAFLQCTEVDFFKKYIIKFEKEFPELLATYQGKEK